MYLGIMTDALSVLQISEAEDSLDKLQKDNEDQGPPIEDTLGATFDHCILPRYATVDNTQLCRYVNSHDIAWRHLLLFH